MKKYFIYTLLFLFIFLFKISKAQISINRIKAEESVSEFMTKKNKDYKAITFGELFEQTYPKEISSKLKTKKQIKYSIIHTYMIGGKKVINSYFHLDDNYVVIGKLTDEEMTEIMLKQTGNKLDSIMNSIILALPAD